MWRDTVSTGSEPHAEHISLRAGKRTRISIAVFAAILLLSITLLGYASQANSAQAAFAPAQVQAPAVTPTPCEGAIWHQVASPNPEIYNLLYDVGVVSDSDAWAVGFTWAGGGPELSLMERWNGTQWAAVPSPNPSNSQNRLRSVAVVASNDIWAVGYYQDSNTFDYMPLVVRWNGSQWTIYPVQGVASDNVRLTGVEAISANDVWAVGSRYNDAGTTTVTLHWNGTQWSENVSGRIPGTGTFGPNFYSVSGTASNDVWAVGYDHDTTLTAHWNGSQWTRIASPNPPRSSENYLRGVVALSPNEVWAVGYYGGDEVRAHPLTMRWNGANWTIISAPDPRTASEGKQSPISTGERDDPEGSGCCDICQSTTCNGNYLFDVAAVNGNEVWAVGSTDRYNFTETGTLVMRWDGTQWAVVPSEDVSPEGYDRLYGVGTGRQGAAWTVGHSLHDSPQTYNTLIERYDASYCPTATPVTPSPTPTQCTGGLGWNTIPTANGPSATNLLKAVGVVSADDIWAVGEYFPCQGCYWTGFIQHWNGSTWTLVQHSIEVGGFEDLAVINANDIWAVGPGYEGPVTAHWDGTTWSAIDNGIYGAGNRLWGIDGRASNDVWAVGELDWEQGPLILHWNGANWSRSSLDIPKQEAGESASGDDPEIVNHVTHLEDVAPISANNVWAVGTIRVSNRNLSLIMHYDGASWSLMTGPSPGTYSNVLEGLAVVAPNDIWAVGYSANDYYEAISSSLAIHWNGSTWSQVATPNPGFGPEGNRPDWSSDDTGTFLHGVTAVSANEVWAVGEYNPPAANNGAQTLTLRWDGSQWSRVASPNPDQSNSLFAVEAISDNYVWAVGQRKPWIGQINSLAMRYGPPCDATPLPTNTPAATNTPRPPTNTPTVPTSTPVPPTATPFPCGVAPLLVEDFERGGTLGPQFVSSVGICQWPYGPCGWHADADYFRSGAYSAVAPAYADVTDQRLTNVTPITVPTGSTAATLQFWHIEEFVDQDGGVLELSTDGGTTWQDAGPSIIEGGYNGTLGGPLNPLAGRQGWTDYTFGVWNRVTVDLLPYAGQSFLFRFRLGTNNSVGTRGWNIDDIVVTATGACVTGTPAVPTVTSMPSNTPSGAATSTAAPSGTAPVAPTATVSACNVSYTDVVPGDTFYSHIMCLACKGLVSGYADGMFRPYNGVTRGQLSKIVSNAAGFNDTPSGQTFTDVPPGHSFYMYIERMAMHGVINGYSDGTFRPDNPATRGQISKIVSEARQYTDPVVHQTFEDVPSTNPFYMYIERLAMHGVMNGYPCGGPGEPCRPSNESYFRPGNNATRGQLAKIVSNTFFPECQP